MNDENSPPVSFPDAISFAPYHSAAAMPRPPSTSMIGGSADSAAVTFMFAR